MFFKKGVVYVNFGGTEMVRFLAARPATVLTANLNLPGGTKEFARDHFEREFTEKVEGIPSARPVIAVERKESDPKVLAKQRAGNPYAR